MKRIIRMVWISTLALSSAWAQEPAAEQQEERRYTVEMIVFTYAQEFASAGEMFFPDPVAEDEPDASNVYSDARDEPEAEEEPLPALEFARLDRSELTMNDIMGHLRRIDIYRPVMHFGWTQSTRSEELTRPIQLSSLAAPASGIDGSLKLYLSRFLHLVVDLQMTAESDAEPDAAPVYYRIQEDRIFRNGELRYFDHPKFGVLARVTRVDEEPAPQGTELLGYPAQ